MRKLLLAALIVIVVLAIVIGIGVYRVNDYLRGHQADFAAQASAALGRPVSFDAIRVSARAGLTITLTNLRIDDDPRFGNGPLLRADAVAVSLEPLPALFGEIRLRSIVLEAPVITVIRTADGVNLESLGSRPAAGAAVRTAAASASVAATASPAPDPHSDVVIPLVAAATLRNGTLRVIDRRTDPAAEITITALDGSAQNLSPTTPVTFTVQAALFGATTHNLSARGTISPQPGASQVVDAELDGVAIDALKHAPGLGPLIPAALSSPGPIHAALRLAGPLDRLSIDLRADAGPAPIRYGAELDKPANVALGLEMRGLLTRDPPALEISAARASLGSVQALVSGALTGASPPVVDLTLAIPRTSLSDLEGVMPGLAGRGIAGTVAVDLHATGAVTATGVAAVTGRIDLADVAAGSPNLPGRLGKLSAAIVFNGDNAVLAPTAVAIGSAPAQVFCRAAPLADPTVTCSLSAAALPLRALGVTATDGDVVDDLDAQATLRPADAERIVHTTLRASRGQVHGMRFTNLAAAAHVQRGVYVLDSATLQSFDGTLRASGTYRVPDGGQPAFDLHASAAGVRVGAFLASQHVAGAERIDGVLDGTTALTGSGREPPAIRASLTGTAQASIGNGVLRGIDLGDDSLAALGGLTSARFRARHPDLFGGQLRFDQMATSLRIATQVVSSDDARLRARDANVDARGTLAFSGGLNVRGTLVLSPSLSGDLFGGGSAARYLTNAAGGLDLPFTLRGTLARPRLRLSPGVVANAVGRGVEDLIGDGATGGTHAGELIKRGLDSLFRTR